MQIRVLDKNDIRDKIKTRELYEENFDINDKPYIDYYYDVIIKRNTIVALFDDNDTVLSMIHLNPYKYNVLGNVYTVHYLVAVVTKDSYRKNGYMMEVMNKAISYLYECREPFCYLMPDTDDMMSIYSKFGFVNVCKFTLDKFSDEKYDIFPVRDSEYNSLMQKEQYFLDKETETYKRWLSSKCIMMKLLYTADSPIKTIDNLKDKRIYICQEA